MNEILDQLIACILFLAFRVGLSLGEVIYTGIQV